MVELLNQFLFIDAKNVVVDPMSPMEMEETLHQKYAPLSLENTHLKFDVCA